MIRTQAGMEMHDVMVNFHIINWTQTENYPYKRKLAVKQRCFKFFFRAEWFGKEFEIEGNFLRESEMITGNDFDLQLRFLIFHLFYAKKCFFFI